MRPTAPIPLVPIYLTAAVICGIAYALRREWFFLPLAGLWAVLAIYYYIKGKNSDKL